jgi:LDH2 family malate/lactate/ureidoglycolate dehydrogenase
MRIAHDELKRLAKAALLKQGYDDAESAQILEVLLYAQLRGNNQGVVKLIGPGIPKSADAGEIESTKETPISLVIDAHHVHPMIAVTHACERAIAKAKENGIAVVGVNHVNTSSGALGYYAGKIAQQGFVAIVLAAGPETVAPAGSTQAIFGTNPLAIGIPGPSEPIVLDMTTAAMAFYGVVEAKAAGRTLPEGIAYDADGNASIDPAKVIRGALLPFDKSQRGSGLSMMIQLLAGPLVGAGSDDMTGNWGHFVLAIDPDILSGSTNLTEGVAKLVSKVKSARKLDGVDEILIPGERGNRTTHDALTFGEMEIEDNLYKQLQKAAGQPV